MNDTLKLIVSLSLSGSIMAGLLFLMKPFMKHRLSKSIQYYLWIMVLLRLVIPFSLDGSIMNYVFSGDLSPASTMSSNTEHVNTVLDENKSFITTDVENSVATGLYNGDTDHGTYLGALINQYVIFIWIAGVILFLTVNIAGYIQFSQKLKKTSIPASEWENRLLTSLLNERYNVRLVRNIYATSPMLIGLRKPIIVIPDFTFNEDQLKNILLHEMTHVKRYDIGVKWFTMVVTSLHWFNPLMYFLKKEINHAGELSCDEAVIRNLSSSEKQLYGEVLISVASENIHPRGLLHATFTEEKSNLKDRLVAIMKYNKKSKRTAIISMVLMALFIGSAVVLGASGGITNLYKDGNDIIIPTEPPPITITHEYDSDPIENYQILKTSWNGSKYDRPSFYQAAWHSEPTLLTGLRRLKPGEKLQVDFGMYTPEKVTVQMAYLTESFNESLLPSIDVSVMNVNGVYEFVNPPAAVSDIPTSGRVFSITATWGDNSCEYVFASDGKFDYVTE
ncbi:M56 family metallopeptidase [Paenibacillus sp. FA6]|uniref:M56 family metallopeptidase n=1 Tax=Paenibacillus sp. FA6 TaxID=3413029 RepID=UPI003F65C15A